jgi:hypothetical protein
MSIRDVINRRPRVLPSNVGHYHEAIIKKRNKVLAIAHNSLGSRSRGAGYSDQTIHAERAVVKNLGDYSQLRGAILLVYRFNSHNELRDSKPCVDCQLFLEKCMREYGLRKVIYSEEKRT